MTLAIFCRNYAETPGTSRSRGFYIAHATISNRRRLASETSTFMCVPRFRAPRVAARERKEEGGKGQSRPRVGRCALSPRNRCGELLTLRAGCLLDGGGIDSAVPLFHRVRMHTHKHTRVHAASRYRVALISICVSTLLLAPRTATHPRSSPPAPVHYDSPAARK